jgi:hypothetical protein
MESLATVEEPIPTTGLINIQLALTKTLVYSTNLPFEHRHLLTSLLVKELTY